MAPQYKDGAKVDRPLIGKSAIMLEIKKDIQTYGQSPISSFLIEGPPGTGKEVVAHNLSSASKCLRPDGPFVAINCAAIPEALIESELFGHERGAFTGAVKSRMGKFEYAHKGTIFLDEIGEMPLSAQAKLLRVLQEKEIQRVGANNNITVDVQVVAATNVNVEKALESGRLRQDLYDRFIVKIRIPPLSERREDIPLLADYLLEKFCSGMIGETPFISSGAKALLISLPFPGNVRNLESIIQKGAVLAGYKEIRKEHILRSLETSQRGDVTHTPTPIRDVENEALLTALKAITFSSPNGSSKPWHETLRSISVTEICRFLNDRGRREFPRKEYSIFLEEYAKNGKDGYVTSGRHLKILKMHGIVVHNEKKANKARYRLREDFITSP